MSYIYRLELRADYEEYVKGSTYIGLSTTSNPYYFTGGAIPKDIIKSSELGRSIFQRTKVIEGEFNEVLLRELEKHYIRILSPIESKKSLNKDIGGKPIPKPEGKEVHQYTIDGYYIRSFKSRRKAAKSLNINTLYLKGEEYSWAGYRWSDYKLDKLKTEHIGYNPIYQYDKKGNFLREFRNISKAVEYLQGKTPNPEYNISYGYRWSKQKLNNLQKIPIKVNRDKDRRRAVKLARRVYQYTPTGELIREWSTPSEAEKMLNITAGSVTKVIKGKRDTCGGFRWSRASNEKFKELTPYQIKRL